MTYGTINVDTLTASTGVLATQNGMTGIAKAWVYYNALTQTVVNSFNVSSVTYNGTGDQTVNFTTAMANANYVPVGVGYTDNNLYTLNLYVTEATPPTTSLVRVVTRQTNTGTIFNSGRVYLAILSN